MIIIMIIIVIIIVVIIIMDTLWIFLMIQNSSIKSTIYWQYLVL